jgi:hypothetical protein
MGKAIIRNTNTTAGGTASAVTTVTIGSTSVESQPIGVPVAIPPVLEITGTLQEIVNGQPTGATLNFRQPLGLEGGIMTDAKVNYTPVLDPSTGQTVAVSLKLVEKGVILTLDASGESGTLQDKASKDTMKFYQPLAAAMGIKAPVPGTSTKGSVVNYDRILDPSTAETVAVSLEVVKV